MKPARVKVVNYSQLFLTLPEPAFDYVDSLQDNSQLIVKIFDNLRQLSSHLKISVVCFCSHFPFLQVKPHLLAMKSFFQKTFIWAEGGGGQMSFLMLLDN